MCGSTRKAQKVRDLGWVTGKAERDAAAPEATPTLAPEEGAGEEEGEEHEGAAEASQGLSLPPLPSSTDATARYAHKSGACDG